MAFSPLTGLSAVLVVLTAASGFALVRRRRDGTFRPVGAEAVDGTAAVAEPTTGTGPTGSTDAEPSDAEPTATAPPADGKQTDTADTLAGLGVRAGTPVTLLQFSSAFCAPCRATRALCHDVAARVPGVHHLEIDAEEHLDAVRALGILRTPTLLVVDATGRIRRRASGAPTRAQLLAAVADVVDVSAS